MELLILPVKLFYLRADRPAAPTEAGTGYPVLPGAHRRHPLAGHP